jgi:OPA family glycerol-3-phosphate transporter-like MFS transporter
MDLLNSLKQFLPILILLAVIGLVFARIPRIEMGHSEAFKRRRRLNWLPLGLTYAFLYMGRYNLTVSKNALGSLMSNADFGTIFFWGTLVYGCAFIINGPLTDKIGGRRAMLIGASGAALSNLAMGLVLASGFTRNLAVVFSVLYAVNMYFQSFGAVAIVKVNAHWFHVRERGVFAGIFGILISLGVYFAYDWGALIVRNAPTQWVFFVPAAILAAFVILDYFMVFDSPVHAGHADFDVADASSGQEHLTMDVLSVLKRMFTNPIIMTIAAVEFCSGFLRNAVMQWYIIFAKQTGIIESFVPHNWGLLLCCAGILGGVFAGVISDLVFDSRRGPVVAVLYSIMLASGVAMFTALGSPALGAIVVFFSLAVIGVHGMMSGTASMDFGGKRNVGIAVGIIDGMVYLGTATQSIIYGYLLPQGAAAKVAANWRNWPMLILPVAIVGLGLSSRLWNAKPASKQVSNEQPRGAGEIPSPLKQGDAAPSAALNASREAGGLAP